MIFIIRLACVNPIASFLPALISNAISLVSFSNFYISISPHETNKIILYLSQTLSLLLTNVTIPFLPPPYHYLSTLRGVDYTLPI